MNIINSPNNSHKQNKYDYSKDSKDSKDEPLNKKISNRTITVCNDDYNQLKYFDQNHFIKETNTNFHSNEKDLKELISNGYAYCHNEIKFKQISEKVLSLNYENKNLESTLLEDNLEFPLSPNDNYNSIINNKNEDDKSNSNIKESYNDLRIKIQKINKNNNDIDSYSFKEDEAIDKTDADAFLNKSILNNNRKNNIDKYTLNLNENDIVSLDYYNLSLNESKKPEDDISVSVNNTIITNKKRGRQKKKNFRNKKDESKNKDNNNNKDNKDNNEIKSNNDFISTISKKNFIENAWVHLSCALWIPEVIIEEFDKKENIKSNKIFKIN